MKFKSEKLIIANQTKVINYRIQVLLKPQTNIETQTQVKNNTLSETDEQSNADLVHVLLAARLLSIIN
ncbi:hypothetical protein [Staphylococcus epidermidis]|uniref:hypothetical protein n=1 Tax=Staphylococcus epidermidis TaxID=1282 RepID=UPI0038B57EB6